MRRGQRRTRTLAIAASLLMASTVLAPSLANASAVPRWTSPAATLGISNVTWLSCSSAHNCAAFGGDQTDAEVSGTWAAPTAIVNLPGGATIRAISCPRPTDCVVGGSSNGQAFLLDETNGSWGTAQLLSGTAPYTQGQPNLYGEFTSSVTAISCVTSTTCTAAGNYTVTLEPQGSLTYAGPGFVATLSAGVWSTATSVSGVDAVTSLECLRATSCTLTGYQSSFTIDVYYPIVTNVAEVATETGSAWSAVAVAGLSDLGGKSGWIDSQASSVSCRSVGNCTVGGNDFYGPDFDGNPVSLYNASYHGFITREVNGVWGNAVELAKLTGVPYLACSSVSHCVAADTSSFYLENQSRWGADAAIVEARHALTLGAVACAPNGPCLVAGARSHEAFAETARAGSWSTPQRLPGLTTVAAASCPATGSCSVAGGARVVSES